jgi:hypothetical protein
MAKKITLLSLDKKFDDRFARLEQLIERGFGALPDVKRDMATKDQIIALHPQVNAIETDLRTTKQHKLVTRVADLEEEIFGKPRG